MTTKICIEPDCGGKHVARGYCINHYSKRKNNGEFTDLRPKAKNNRTEEGYREFIKENVLINEETGCWEWQRSKDENGYGQIGYEYRPTRAHRIAYKYFVGPLLKGMHIDHRCRNASCCNPDHLRQITASGNAQHKVGNPAHNTSGHVGVYYNKQSNKWYARINVDGKQISLGSYDTFERAVIAREEGEEKYHPFKNPDYLSQV